jgi:hypothetical protein
MLGRGRHRRQLPICVLAFALIMCLASCTTARHRGAPPQPSSTLTSSSVASGEYCSAANLRIRIAAARVVRGDVSARLSIANIGSQECRLKGTVHLALLGRDATRLATVQGSSETPAPLVTVGPIKSSTSGGHAYVELMWVGPAGCIEPSPQPFALLVELPTGGSFQLAFRGTNGTPLPAPCKGQISVSPIQQAAI